MAYSSPTSMSSPTSPTPTCVTFANVAFDIHNLVNVTFCSPWVCSTGCEFDLGFIARPTWIFLTTAYGRPFIALICITLVLLYLYVAFAHYPQYRYNRHFTRRNDKTTTTSSDTSILTSQNLIVYVLAFPFAIVYISLRIAWDLYKLCVFYSLDMMEFALKLSIRAIKSVPRGLGVLWRDYLWIAIKYIVLGIQRIIWPIVRALAVTSWKLLKFGYDISCKTCAYLWNAIKRFSVFVIKPIMWTIKRAVYLSRIGYHVACFIIRDVLEDVRDMVSLGCDSARWIWHHTLIPIGNFVHYASVYLWETGRMYGPIIRAYLYKRVVIDGKRELTWIVSEILRDPILRWVVATIVNAKQLISQCLYSLAILMKQFMSQVLHHLTILMKHMFQGLYSTTIWTTQRISRGLYFMTILLKKRMTQGLYTMISSLSALSVDLYVSGLWLYHEVLAPLMQIIPATLTLMLEITHTMYTGIAAFCEWTYLVTKSIIAVITVIFKPIYTGLVTPVFLGLYKLGTVILSQSVALILYSWSPIQYLFILLYNSLSSLFIAISELSISIYKVIYYGMVLMSEVVIGAITFVSGIMYAPCIRLAQFVNELYGRCQVVVVDTVAAVSGTIDNAVVAVGDAMMEWVKKEQAVREAIRGSTS
ncbi:11449_t:CDS:1 [Paraglomus brasilianum]|uniref:11449_t:CDS:1 n=1 Tax=Paraglomus brasilianum TaxID=144538 RepID=A0A9N9C0G3_9GLOM|nr:11449_t:CDS:1 [Paraglomus brasilianum]